MSRGIPSQKAIDAAVAIARTRGQVIFLKDYPGSACDFLVITPYGIIAVCVRRTRQIRADIAEIAMVFNDTLNRIRAVDHCPGIWCEFWLWSPYGTMRFFAVDGFRLTELSLAGLPLAPVVTGRFAGQPAHPAEAPGNLSAGTPAGTPGSPGPAPGAAPEQKNPGPAPGVPGRPAATEPHFIRFLRRRNAEVRQKKEEESRQTGKGPAAGTPPGAGDDALPT